ncbi:hypothetical protein DFH11DRAFT_1515867 [Phellopilus nigrolimitatus]|nr:hypothetical protein DFH11DRAFT_1515867 [Phellopilus nigrolimitatus]
MHSIRSDVEPVDPSLVPLFISEIDISQYTGVAILTLLVYNTIITMDKEIKYFWSSPRAFVSLIYFTVNNILHFIYRYILLMRVLALYHQDKRLAACLRTLFGLEAVFGLGLLIYPNIYEEVVVGDLAKGVAVCIENRDPPKVWSALSWLVPVAAPMLYAIILMVLALYKAAEHWRETAGFSQFTLVKVLIMDQAIYFIMVIFCSVTEIIGDQLFAQNVIVAQLLTILGSPSLLCVLGSHLLVHLKEAGERGANGGTSYRMKTMSSIGFS